MTDQLLVKEFLSALAIVLTFAAFFPYIISIQQGHTKPHVFSWVIWSIATLIVFFAQLTDQGGVGAWPIGISAVLTFYIALLAYQHKSDISITRTDWLFFISALLTIPMWYLTSDPLWAVIILTTIDSLGFGPTFRKCYVNPFAELLILYVIVVIRNVFSIVALEHYSTTTILFPAVMAVMYLLFIAMVLFRRHKIKTSAC